MTEHRTRAQRWADSVTEFSGSWKFIIGFTVAGALWMGLNITRAAWDPYPYLFLNIVLTVISTLQSPFIMLSQNRQNETDQEYVRSLHEKLDKVLVELAELKAKEVAMT